MNRTVKNGGRLPARSLVGVILLLLVGGLVGCGDNPVHNHDHCDHFDADGLVVEQLAQLVAWQWQGDVDGVITLTAAAAVEFSVTFLDADSTRISVPVTCVDHRLGWTVADTSIVQVESVPDQPWRVMLHGRQVGDTTLRLRFMHDEHADFTSQPLPVQVMSTDLAPLAGHRMR